jgi:hypothetical protein
MREPRASAGRARPRQPLPRDDAPHGGSVVPARGRPRTGRRVVRARLRRGGEPRDVAGDRSRARRAVPGRRRAGRLDECRVVDQAIAGGRGPGSLRGTGTSALVFACGPRRRASGACPRLASTHGAPHACAPCSPTRCPSSRSRRWSSWRGSTWLVDPAGACAVLEQVRDPAAAAHPAPRDRRSPAGGAVNRSRRHARRRLVVDGAEPRWCRCPHPSDLSRDRRAALHLRHTVKTQEAMYRSSAPPHRVVERIAAGLV